MILHTHHPTLAVQVHGRDENGMGAHVVQHIAHLYGVDALRLHRCA
jgi:hypothetical protein